MIGLGSTFIIMACSIYLIVEGVEGREDLALRISIIW